MLILAGLYFYLTNILSLLMSKKIDCLSMRSFAMLLLLFLSLGAFAQRQVTGKVTSGTDNAPLGYATVAVKGTKVATLTNADGTFSLTMPAGKNALVISSVGYEDQEVDATSGTVNVAMKARTSCS